MNKLDLRALFLGTLDCLFDLGPGIAKKHMTRALYARVPKPQPRKDSSFFLVRFLKGKTALNVRAGHVMDEDGFVSLDATDEPMDVEYVIQLHDAKRAGRHLDLRISYKGVAVSWAIPMKGKRDGMLSLPQRGERWACIRQPDHLLSYLGFEGEILSGKGEGTVEIVAQGTARIFKMGEDGSVHLRFLTGIDRLDRLGDTRDLVLVRTGQEGERSGLIVGKGPAIEEAIESWTKPRYIRKDLAYAESAEGHLVAESKVDGAAVEIRWSQAGEPRVFSHRVSRRTDQLIEHTKRLPQLQAGHQSVRDGSTQATSGGDPAYTRLRAEAWHPRGVNFLSGTLNSLPEKALKTQQRAGPIRLQVFDITHYKGKDVRALPYAERRALYESTCQELGNPYVQPVRQVKSGFGRFYNQQVSLKKMPTDGIVLKNPEVSYDEEPWIKVKPSDLVDCEVIAVTEGQGKHRGRLGALTVQTPEGHRVQVGTGFTDEERRWIRLHQSDVLGETARVGFHIRGGDRTNTGPRFDSWHPDKSEASLLMYAEALDPDDPSVLYKLKSSAGWRRK